VFRSSAIRPVTARAVLTSSIVGLTLALLLGAAGEARAEGFISPFIGYDFGGDANCPRLKDCEDKRLNAGLTLGVTGNVFGFEEEFAYAKDFFGTAPGLSSSVVTVMSNAMFIPKIGPVRPYVLAGLGLIKTHVESLDPASIFTSDNNNFGWDVGGGLMISVAPHIAVRGDIRYFHAFQDLQVLFTTLNGEKLDFGRASGAVVFRF
jgi:opacity protein-like surface antigen